MTRPRDDDAHLRALLKQQLRRISALWPLTPSNEALDEYARMLWGFTDAEITAGFDHVIDTHAEAFAPKPAHFRNAVAARARFDARVQHSAHAHRSDGCLVDAPSSSRMAATRLNTPERRGLGVSDVTTSASKSCAHWIPPSNCTTKPRSHNSCNAKRSAPCGSPRQRSSLSCVP